MTNPKKKKSIINFFHLSSWIIGVIGLVSGFIFYFISVREREPTLIIDPLKPVLVDKDLLKNRPLNVLDSSGVRINDNVSILTFYFFNQGKESIRREDVLETIKLKLVPNGRILDFKILKASRNVCSIRLLKGDSISGSIEIGFRILEQNDGVTGQVIYEGDKNSTLEIGGTIVGVNEFKVAYEKWTINDGIQFGILGILGIIQIFVIRAVYAAFKYKPTLEDEIEMNVPQSPVMTEYYKAEEDLSGIQSKGKRTITDRFTSRYQLVIRKAENLAEKDSFSFTYAKVVVVSITLFSLLFISSLFLSKALFTKWGLMKENKSKIEVPETILPIQ